MLTDALRTAVAVRFDHLLSIQLKITLPVMTILTEYSKKHLKKDLTQEVES